MTLLIPPGFSAIAMEMRCVGDPDPWFVTFGVDSSGLEGDGVAIGTNCNAAWAQIGALMPAKVVAVGCTVTVGQDGPDPVRYYIVDAAYGEGTNAGAKLPQNCAALVHKDTAVGGRRARGRMFLPLVIGEGECDDLGVLSVNMKNSIDTGIQGFKTDLADNNGVQTPMVLLHNSQGVSAPIEPTPVIALRLDPVVSTQRRRLR